MQIIKDPREMQRLAQTFGCSTQTLGFVPTMGALHDGHLELCRRARAENSRFVASIFVNPAQFNQNEDLNRYPRPLERDLELLERAGCDAVFTPDARAMYGDSDLLHGTWIDVSPFDEMWEGVTRPGHLRGVATVVAKLFNITLPTRAYFGEKDFQQLRVVESLVRDLNFPAQIVPVETMREKNGLAMSSRNAHLSEVEKEAASAIYRALQAGTRAAQGGETDVTVLGQVMNQVLETQPLLQAQYVAVVNSQTLQPLQHLSGEKARILIAAHLGQVRLIDNMAI
ncbi:pantothenate synthetase [Abditibacterium utsteinense]|uniref:Pantothenate synthetase n=1 Tax=Abditibacterium utsteinense TaxID=1960156 RepID=A0A2S8STY1_9BACT|nr:pantoate--beta-alanine ligase [Abditibacterium utsteinense]PQV64250.1 pantothenate synthetase [Abditibacterium utsteinense]